jgi:hypothetical protein
MPGYEAIPIWLLPIWVVSVLAASVIFLRIHRDSCCRAVVAYVFDGVFDAQLFREAGSTGPALPSVTSTRALLKPRDFK